MLAQAPVMRTQSGHNQVSVESAMQLIEQMEKTLTPRQKPVQRVCSSAPCPLLLRPLIAGCGVVGFQAVQRPSQATREAKRASLGKNTNPRRVRSPPLPRGYGRAVYFWPFRKSRVRFRPLHNALARMSGT
jgi:hypothetical protein